MNKKLINKIDKIINEGCDSRMTIAILNYIIDVGYENIKELTDEDIANMKNEPLMTKEFQTAFVTTARELCRQFKSIDLITYIANIDMVGAEKHTTYLYKDQFSDDGWEDVIYSLNIDDEDPESIEVMITVIENEEE